MKEPPARSQSFPSYERAIGMNDPSSNSNVNVHRDPALTVLSMTIVVVACVTLKGCPFWIVAGHVLVSTWPLDAPRSTRSDVKRSIIFWPLPLTVNISKNRSHREVVDHMRQRQRTMSVIDALVMCSNTKQSSTGQQHAPRDVNNTKPETTIESKR